MTTYEYVDGIPRGEDAPRDRPDPNTEREALMKVRPYQGMVAWPTVFLALGILIAFVAVTALACLRIIPLWAGLVLNTLILYADQTPLHEACHGNIAGKDSSLTWLNHLVGYVAGTILLHEYKAFRHMHLAHHRETNNPDLDPDHWVDVHGFFPVLFRCLTIVFWYQHYFWKYIAFKPHIPGMRPLAIHIMVAYAIYYGLAIGLSVMGYWREVLMLWIFPHVLASALIIYLFAYLAHQPHVARERYRDTNVFWFKGKIAGPLVNALYFFQNFHLVHHLFPRVPFYLYDKAFFDLKPTLDKERARIHEFGKDYHPGTYGEHSPAS
jgi:fatty acid desaturase